MVARLNWLAFPIALLTIAGSEAAAAPRPQVLEKKSATRERVTARRDAPARVRDQLAALVARPAPTGLDAEQRKLYDQFLAQTRVVIDGCDALQAKLSAGLANPKINLDQLSEMGEEESLRLQLYQARASKLMRTLSTELKKTADSASTSIADLK